MKKHINLKKDILSITIELKPIGIKKDKIKYLTSDVISLLEKDGYKIKDILVKTMVTNVSDKNLVGTWVFKIDIPEKKNTIVLTKKEGEKLIEIIDNPQPPTEALKNLMKKQKKEKE
jgi:hypothetical protein